MRARLILLPACLAVAACAGPFVPRPSPSLPSTPPPSVHATAAPTSPQAIERGGLLYAWYVDDSHKAAYVAHRDGTGGRRILADVAGDIRALGWTPDGERMTFVVREPTHPDGAIWTAAADGGGADLFYDGRADGCDSVFHPVWSPDGGRLAMVCYRAEGSALAVLDVSTTKLRLLVTYPAPEFLDNPARWSPDGRRLAYDVMRWDPSNSFIVGSRIATILADGSAGPTDLDEMTSFAARPAWSLDGSTLIYNSFDLGAVNRDVASDIFTMLPDGSGVEPFVTAAQAGAARLAHPLWDPDGTRIWVTAKTGAGIRIAWLDPGTRQLTVLPVDGAAAEPRP